jgi:Flp pilus assembly protein TadD
MPLRYGVVRREQTPGFFVDQVRQFARADPAGFLRGLADKAVQFVSARELPRNEDLYVHRQWSVMLRLLAWKAGGFGFPFGVVLPLAAVGFCWSARRLPVSVLLFLALFPAAVISVFVTSRYRIPAVPAFIILACEGAAVLGAAIRQRRWGRAGAAAGVGFAALTLACVPGPFPQEAAGYEAEMYYCLAGRASAAGDQRGAEARVRRALAIRPDYADAHNSLGVIYEKTGRLALAEQSYRQAVTLHRSNATARVNLGRLLEKNGQVEAAAGYYTEALRIDPNRPEVFDRLGIVSLRQNRFEKAVEYFCLSLTLNPNNAGAHCNLGIALKHLGRVDEAAAELAKALELDPSLTEARQVLAELGGR